MHPGRMTLDSPNRACIGSPELGAGSLHQCRVVSIVSRWKEKALVG